MNKADVLLTEFCKQQVQGASVEQIESLISITHDHLNRKERMIEGSKWLCNASCFVRTTNNSVAVFGLAGDVVTLEDGGSAFSQIKFKGHLYIIPREQFLACFIPKELEV